MSATIYWRALPTTNKTLPVNAPSSFITAMERAFNRAPPWTVGVVDLPILRGMAAAFGGNDRDNPFETMVGLIENGDRTIEVWPQY